MFFQTCFEIVRDTDIKMVGFLRGKDIDVFHVSEIIELAKRKQVQRFLRNQSGSALWAAPRQSSHASSSYALGLPRRSLRSKRRLVDGTGKRSNHIYLEEFSRICTIINKDQLVTKNQHFPN